MTIEYSRTWGWARSLISEMVRGNPKQYQTVIQWLSCVCAGQITHLYCIKARNRQPRLMKGQLTLGHNNPLENLSAQQTDASHKACAQRLRLYIGLWHGQLAFERNKRREWEKERAYCPCSERLKCYFNRRNVTCAWHKCSFISSWRAKAPRIHMQDNTHSPRNISSWL